MSSAKSPIYVSADCLVIRTEAIPGSYLSTFFNTEIGRALVNRGGYGAAQPHIAPDYLRTLRIPRNEQVERIVEQKLALAKQRRDDSERLYAEAQALLAAELGLDRLDLSESLYSVRRVSEVVAAGRVDAEYYKPKYQRLLEHLRSTGQAVRLGDWVREPIRRGVQPEYAEDGEIMVVNSQHVGKTQVELDDNRKTSRQFCKTGTNKRAVVHKHDVLLNSTGYITIGRCQTLLDDVNAMVDGHVSIIRPKQGLDPVFLGMYLNALAGQMQTERGWTGSSGQIELRIEVIADFLVWKAPSSVQFQIRQLVEQSYQARRDAKRLLAEAKAEVERIIEEG